MRIVQEALTFDDVLRLPAYSEIIPREVDCSPPLTARGAGLCVRTDNGDIYVMPPDEVSRRFAESPPSIEGKRPYVLGQRLRVASLDRSRECLIDGGVPFAEAADPAAPCTTSMQTRRARFVASRTRAPSRPTGIMASRKGSATDAPKPRRKVRRGTELPVRTFISFSPLPNVPLTCLC